MQPLASSTCYHCDRANVSREHVPPKCLFPKGRDWSRLITVPSCKAHNNSTSTADEYLKFLLSAAADGSPQTIVASAARGAVRQALKRSRNLHRYGFAWTHRDAVDVGRKFHLDYDLVGAALEKMSRALYFHHHAGRRKLLIALRALPVFVRFEQHSDPHFQESVARFRAVVADEFATLPKLGEHQEVFAYQIIETHAALRVNMEFYGVHHASVIGLAPSSSDSTTD